MERTPTSQPRRNLGVAVRGAHHNLCRLRPAARISWGEWNEPQRRSTVETSALRFAELTTTLQAYGLLKLTGRAEGMEALRRDLSGMFTRTKRSAKPANEADAPPRREAA